MEFIGKNGVAAPRLKDAEIDIDAAHVAYLDCVRLMWRMYELQYQCQLLVFDVPIENEEMMENFT